jgi:uncharacterized protein YkwD
MPAPRLLRRALPALAAGLAAALSAASVAGPLAAPAAAAARKAAHRSRHAARHHGHRAGAHAAPGSAASPASCPNAGTLATSASDAQLRGALLCLINRERTNRGLPPLRESWRLDRSAQSWTNAMVMSGSFTHGADFASRISAVGFSWQQAGENIATGYPTPWAVVQAWMASTDHCQNILSPLYSFVGSGLNRHPVRPFGTGPATWTQDFALPMNAGAPSHDWGPYRGCPY